MSPIIDKKSKKVAKTKIKKLIPKNFKLSNLNFDTSKVIETAKNKIGKFYDNVKKERENERKKLEKKRNLLIRHSCCNTKKWF